MRVRTEGELLGVISKSVINETFLFYLRAEQQKHPEVYTMYPLQKQ